MYLLTFLNRDKIKFAESIPHEPVIRNKTQPFSKVDVLAGEMIDLKSNTATHLMTEKIKMQPSKKSTRSRFSMQKLAKTSEKPPKKEHKDITIPIINVNSLFRIGK